MIIPVDKQLTPSQLEEVEGILAEFQCSLQPIAGATRVIYAIMGDERHEVMINRLDGLNYISRVDTIQSPYKLMDRKSDLANHPITIAGIELTKEFLVIAGQCTIDVDNPNLFIETAHAVKEAGAHVLRGGAWKPRTSPYTYQGSAKAMDILLQAAQQTGMPLTTEVMEVEHVEISLKNNIDVLQVGTRNALNYSLLKNIGSLSTHQNTLILLKRSLHMGKLGEFLCAAEYVASAGNPNILLCPRGTVPAIDGYRNYPDECITPLLKQKTWAPVVVDPSHSVGKAMYVPHAALAAASYGADGLVIECHIDPIRGIGDDPNQAISPEVLRHLISDAKEIFKRKQRYQNSYLSSDKKQKENAVA